MTAAITPFSLLSSSLIGGLYLACLKFLILDLPGQYYKLRNDLSFHAKTWHTKLKRDREILSLIRRAENGIYERTTFIHSLMEPQADETVAETSETDSISKTSSEHLTSLYEEEGRLLGMGEMSLASYEVCKTALLSSILHQRELFLRLVDSSKTVSQDELQSHLWKYHLLGAQVNEAIGHIGDLFDLSENEVGKSIDDLRADLRSISVKAIGAVLCIFIITTIFWRMMR